jgi:hypothetical protein
LDSFRRPVDGHLQEKIHSSIFTLAQWHKKPKFLLAAESWELLGW